MSLEGFRRTRMVVLGRNAKAYQAARAMEDNHIGAVLVAGQPGLGGIVTDRDLALAVLGGGLDPATTALEEIMSAEVVSCDIGADLAEVVRLMQEQRVRRIPLTEGGRPVGLVTFDDLVLDGSVGRDVLEAIVTAQLEVEAPQKPAGELHPQASAGPAGRVRALMRARARAEARYNRMVGTVIEATGLDRDRDRAERALLIVAGMLCRRLTADEARHLIAQLPSMLQPHLEECADGPDRAVSTRAIEEELVRALGIGMHEAEECVESVFRIVGTVVSPGQIAEVRGQLPEDMKVLLPA